MQVWNSLKQQKPVKHKPPPLLLPPRRTKWEKLEFLQLWDLMKAYIQSVCKALRTQEKTTWLKPGTEVWTDASPRNIQGPEALKRHSASPGNMNQARVRKPVNTENPDCMKCGDQELELSHTAGGNRKRTTSSEDIWQSLKTPEWLSHDTPTYVPNRVQGMCHTKM